MVGISAHQETTLTLKGVRRLRCLLRSVCGCPEVSSQAHTARRASAECRSPPNRQEGLLRRGKSASRLRVRQTVNDVGRHADGC